MKLEIKTEKSEPVTPRRPRPSFKGSPAHSQGATACVLDRKAVNELATSVNKVGDITEF